MSKIFKEVLDEFKHICILSYGSKLKKMSDVDVLIIGNLAKDDKDNIIKMVKEIHLKYGFKIDEEVSYLDKLFISFDELRILLNDSKVSYFDDITDQYVQTDLFIKRLKQNALITFNDYVFGDNFISSLVSDWKYSTSTTFMKNIVDYLILDDIGDLTTGYYKDFLGFKNPPPSLIDIFPLKKNKINLKTNTFLWSLDETNSHYDYTNFNLLLKELLQANKNEVIYESGCFESMFRIWRLYQPKRIYMAETTFYGFDGINGVEYPPLKSLKQKFKQESLVYLCNPNNPTLEYHDSKEILSLALENPSIIFVVDETHLMFSTKWTSLSLSSDTLPNNVLVIASLSKLLGVPGRRLGIIIGNSFSTNQYINFFGQTSMTNDNIEYIKSLKEHGNIINIQRIYRNTHQILKTLKSNIFEMEIGEIPSGFILMKFPSKEDKQKAYNILINSGIDVSWVWHYKNMENYLRITASFVQPIKKIIKRIEEKW